MSRSRLVLLALAVGLFMTPVTFVRAEETDELANALKGMKITLQDGLKTSEREGNPISAKFEIEHDALQISVYTFKGGDFMEVVEDPKTGSIRKSEKITEDDDLKEAEAQKAAMTNAKVSLLAATEAAVKDNAGFRAVGVFPELRDGHPVAEVTLLQGTNAKKVVEKLD